CPSGSILFNGNYAVSEISPTWWGASGAASAALASQTTAAFQAALNAVSSSYPDPLGPAIRVPPGDYIINGALTITRASTSLIGAGAGYTDAATGPPPACRIHASSGLAVPLLQATTALHGVAIERLGFYGPGAVSGAKGVYAVSPGDWTIRNCFFTSFGDQAIHFSGGVAGLIE